MKGIDVSEHNGTVDWQTAKNAGLQFAVLRCGYGSDLQSQDDPTYVRNVQECERLSIPYGVYLYSYALTVEDAKSELAHILRLVKGCKPQFPIYLDMEDADSYKKKNGMPSRRVLTDIIKTVCQGLKNAGYLAGYYVNKDWYTNYIYPGELQEYHFWYARPGVEQPDNACGVWQDSFPETGGRWPGANIPGSGCDTNVSYENYPLLVRKEGLNNWIKEGGGKVQKAASAATGGVVWTKCIIDTTMDVTKPAGVCYTVKMTCSERPVIRAGTDGVVCICPVTSAGENIWLCNLVGFGKGESGIYTEIAGEDPCKRFVYKVQ